MREREREREREKENEREEDDAANKIKSIVLLSGF